MSIHHEVTVHCDTCGEWERVDGEPARKRRRRGWRMWKDEYGSWRHSCPKCTKAAR
jgi:hypothetical protein